jgi:hypothetical protein
MGHAPAAALPGWMTPASETAPASRSLSTCYNSAREKTGTLKTPFAPAIRARESHLV